MTQYTNQLTPEQLIRFIATEPRELSHEKVELQLDFFKKICQEWLDYRATVN